MAMSADLDNRSKSRRGFTDPQKFLAVHYWMMNEPKDALSSKDRSILSVLAAFLNERNQAYPSIDTISEMSGYGRTAIKAGLTDLHSRKVIHVNGNFGNSSTYTFPPHVFENSKVEHVVIDNNSREDQVGGRETTTTTATNIPLNSKQLNSSNSSSVVVVGNRPGDKSTDTDSPWFESVGRKSKEGTPKPVLWFEMDETRPHVRYCLETLVRLGLKDRKWVERDLKDPLWHYTVSKIMIDEWLRYEEAMQPDDPRWRIVFSSAIADMMEHRPKAIKPATEFRNAIEDRREWFVTRQAEEKPPEPDLSIIVPELGRSAEKRRTERELDEAMAAKWRKPPSPEQQARQRQRKEETRILAVVRRQRALGYSDEAIRVLLSRDTDDEATVDNLMARDLVPAKSTDERISPTSHD
jgi:hypothetical protein